MLGTHNNYVFTLHMLSVAQILFGLSNKNSRSDIWFDAEDQRMREARH